MKAIGSPDEEGRREQLRSFARCLVWSGYCSDIDVRAEVYEAALAEIHDAPRATVLTEELIHGARTELREARQAWTSPTPHDALHAALADMRSSGMVVLEYVDDHWAASEALQVLADRGRRATGIAFFTATDVWHAVEHGMLEINVWHGDSANVAPGDALLDEVLAILHRHGIEAVFDEGRIEATVAWQPRVSFTS